MDDTVENSLARGHELYRQRRYEEAAQDYQAALDVDPDNWSATVGLNRAIRRSIPRWHFEMLNDDERADRYEKAIRQVVQPGHLVLDVGTGSGLLSLMAARAGADHVVACEAQPLVADVARRIIAAAGYGDRVSVVPKMSTDLQVGVDLPRRADVLVTETVDCGLLGEGILPIMEHARQHLLTENAVIVPGRATVVAQFVESVSLHRKNHVSDVQGFDLSIFNELSSLEYYDSRLRRHEHQMLSEPFEVFRFDFYRDRVSGRQEELVVTPTATGTCHAIAFWFEMELTSDITLTNSPAHTHLHWKQAIQTLPAAPRVRAGEPVRLNVRHDDSSIYFTINDRA